MPGSHSKEVIIKDNVFDTRGDIPANFLNQLAIRGGSKNVDDALSRFDWDGKVTRVTTIVSTHPETGDILGSRWAVRGNIATFNQSASSVWQGANKDLNIEWNLTGEDFSFSNRGSALPANFSDWIDARASNVAKIKNGNEVIPWEDILADIDDTSVSVRLEIHTTDAKTAMVYLTMIPLPLQNIINLCEKWEVDVSSDRLPVVILSTGTESCVKKGAISADLMVQEPRSMKCGMGILPLLEQVQNNLVNFS